MASRVCWNCGIAAHHTPCTEQATRADDGRWFLACTCDNCRTMSIATANIAHLADDHRSTAKSQMSGNKTTLAWYPQHTLGRRFEHVPDTIAAAASEVWACYSVAQYRAATIMARATVEAICKDQGAATGNLQAKIEHLYEQEVISRGAKDAAHEIRFLGNDMAHGDFVTAIDEEEAADILNFLEVLLEEIYQRPAQLNAHRQRRLHRATTPTT